ncbi:Nuclear transcription factor Y subunit B-3 [Apostasia shenzhenica]|uniref:Nuclear transcription factor Y subunit B-3 n=1 Tax=Apostasia shenzhenica TaxID=1088818 RepID=A0A2I0AZU0_9ASPA|nr:Nuclear transcription factor Y subunit B-3 [Apostasia shenzhenica]
MVDSDNESGGQNNSIAAGNGELASQREQDRFLPIANVSRIMKKALPANAKISKDAKETVQECVSEFISFITGEASDKCQREKRKTVNGDDLLWAMATLGFEDYVEPLKIYLHKFRELEGDKSAASSSSQPQSKDAAAGRGSASSGGNDSSAVRGSNGGGYAGVGMYPSGGFMVMGQPTYGSSQSPVYHHQMAAMGSFGTSGNSSSSSSGIGRQGKL